MKRGPATLLLLLVPALLVGLAHCGADDAAPTVVTGDAGAAPGDASGAVADAPASVAPPPIPCTAPVAGWARCPDSPVVVAGARLPSGLVETSTGDPDVLWDPDERLWKMWWSTGAAPSYAKADGAPIHLKYAESQDGLTWTAQAAPVLESATDATRWDDSALETPTVIKVASNPPERRYVMFYAGVNRAVIPREAAGFDWYQLGVAFSADGRRFTRLPAAESPYAKVSTPYANVEGLVLLGRDAFPGVAGVEDGIVADPEVVFDGAGYHLFFSSYASRVDRKAALAYGVGHADLPSMAAPLPRPRTGNPVLEGATQPSVVRGPAGFEMFVVYDSDADKARSPLAFPFSYWGPWRHTSTDLATFSAKPATYDFAFDGAGPQDRYGMVKAGDMAYADGVYRYYYPAFGALRVPEGFYAPVRRDAGIAFPPGTLDLDPDGGVVYPPAVFGIDVAVRR